MGRHSRNKTRVSRPLLAALGVTIAVGGGVYIHNLKTAHVFGHDNVMTLKAVDPIILDVKSSSVPAVEAAAPLIPNDVLVTQTPGGSTTQPTPAAIRANQTPLPRSSPATQPANTTKSPAASNAVLASAAVSARPLADAKAKIDAGELLEARAILNDALLAGHLNPADAASVRDSLSQINQTVFFSKKKFKDDPFQVPYQVQSGDRLAKIADRNSVTWELLCRINGLADARKVRAGQWIKIPNGPFHCVITKSSYRLDVYLGSPGEAGSLFVTRFAVGLGKDNSTPTGQWLVQQGTKAHPATYYSPRGEGVIAANDPKNPLGGYWIGLTGVSGNALEKNSYGIHGTIEPDSIGKQASLGCIRLGHDDIALLYELLVDGKSKVVVKD